MKFFSLILIAIIIHLTSSPVWSKSRPPRSFVGGGGGGANTGYRSGGPGGYIGSLDDSNKKKRGEPSVGYKSGSKPGKPAGGGDPGASIVVIPKRPVVVLPAECKEPVKVCITNHIAGDGAKEPQHRGPCCTKLRHAVPCVCKFLTSKNPKLIQNANGVLRGCHYRKPICIKMPMPQTCRPEVRQCVNMHMYGKSPKPTFRGPCCNKFKTSKSCVTEFLKSPDPKLSEAAQGVIQGCHFL